MIYLLLGKTRCKCQTQVLLHVLFWKSLSILILFFKCFVSIKNVKKNLPEFCLTSMCDAAFCYRI